MGETNWTLVCITRLGKVSMLRDLDTYTARETYKRLRPDEWPTTHIFSNRGPNSWSTMGRSYGPKDDWLDKVEVVGPPGEELDAWHGVEPRIHDHRSWEEVQERDAAELAKRKEADRLRAEWPEHRKDFWNHPRLWHDIGDPITQMCWMKGE